MSRKVDWSFVDHYEWMILDFCHMIIVYYKLNVFFSRRIASCRYDINYNNYNNYVLILWGTSDCNKLTWEFNKISSYWKNMNAFVFERWPQYYLVSLKGNFADILRLEQSLVHAYASNDIWYNYKFLRVVLFMSF